jgi:Raf kinase inhibitor-like YbhB/YbcL family protein
MRSLWILACLSAFLIVLAGCQGKHSTEPTPVGRQLQVESAAFVDGETIPVQYTCDGQGTSPPLSWAEPPAGTQSLALILDDPDAPVGTFVHWVLFNLPPATRSLPEGVPPGEQAEGGLQGTNNANRQGFNGPCPPKGSTHRYFFKIYALDTTLDLQAGASKADVEKAMAGHVLAQGQIVGQYGR